MTVSSANVMRHSKSDWNSALKEFMKLHGVFTRGGGSLWKCIFWMLQGAEDLYLTQSQWYVRVEYSHSTTSDPTTIQGHQILGTAGDA